MRSVRFIVILISAMLLSYGNAVASHYQISKVSGSVYAATAEPNGKVASNAFFVVTDYEVILAGAHFITEGVKELIAEIAKITPLPVNRIILTHHHKGFNYLDFDLPEKAEVVASVNVWQALKGESREFKNPAVS
jgi:cyclase